MSHVYKKDLVITFLFPIIYITHVINHSTFQRAPPALGTAAAPSRLQRPAARTLQGPSSVTPGGLLLGN